MSAVIQSIIATVSSGGSSGPPPVTQINAVFSGDDPNRGMSGQNGWWTNNNVAYSYSTFSTSAPAWNSIIYKNGNAGHTYDFTGTEWINSPDLKASGGFADDQISLNFWFYPTANNVQLLVEADSPNPSSWSFQYSMLEITSGNNIKAKFFDGTAITSVNAITLNQWNHIYFAEIWTGDHILEVNGVPTNGNPNYVRVRPTAECFAIGAVTPTSMGSTGAFQGKIGQLEIHDYVAGSTYIATKSKYIEPTLILNLDASNSTSYPGTGVAWTSLVGSTGATLVGGPTYYNAGGVKGISFTGGSYATVPADVWFDQDFTIVAWVNVSSLAAWSRIIDFGNGQDLNNVILSVSGGPNGYPVSSTSEIGNVTGNTQIPLNTWVHVVGRLTPDSTLSIWVNGVNVGSANYGPHWPANTTRSNCYIGKSNWASDAYLDGTIGELRIYRGALSDADINFDYLDTYSKYNPPTMVLNLDAGNVASYPGTGTTWTDTVSNIPFTLYNGVGYNSGNGGYLTFQASSNRYAASTTSLSDLNTWTVEAWTFWNGQNTGTLPAIVTEAYEGGNINYVLGAINGGNTDLQTGLYKNTAWYSTDPGYTLTSNQWYHLVSSYDGHDFKVFVNGVRVALSHQPGLVPTSGGSGINLMKRWDYADYWGGRLGIVRIYNGAMGTSSVKANYDATKARFGLT